MQGVVKALWGVTEVLETPEVVMGWMAKLKSWRGNMVILGGDKACLGGKGGVSGGKDIMLLGTLSRIPPGEEVAYIKKKKKNWCSCPQYQ